MRRGRLLHRCPYVLLRNAAGHVLVHRRTDTKDVFPGAHDLFAGGVCGAGESYDSCARREVEEELGVTGVDLAFLFKHRYRSATGQAWGAVYEGRWDGEVRPQPSEVAWFAWIPPEQLDRMAAAIRKIPVVGASTAFSESGALLSYAPHGPSIIRDTARYVDRLLRGGRPADLPVEQPARFDLIVNQKTARARGLTLPPALLLRADRVIE